MRLADGAVEVASGFDALYLSGRAVLLREWLQDLAASRERAVASGGPEPVTVAATEFQLQPHGFGKYRYCLDHRFARVGVTESSRLPALRVQPRAEFLHGVGPFGVVEWCDRVLSSVCIALRWSVSRLDLYADWQCWRLDGDDRHRFVCRGDSLTVHEIRRDFTGLEFGRRSSGTICARIYDKTVDAARTGAGFWEEIWAGRWTPELTVLRVEFEFGREGLRQFGVDTPVETVEAAGGLWAYATGTWLSLRVTGVGETRSGWPVDPVWEAIKCATVRGGAHGTERMYAGRQAGTLNRITPGLLGYVSSFGAIVGTEDVEDTLGELGRYVASLERDGKERFADRVVGKVRGLAWR